MALLSMVRREVTGTSEELVAVLSDGWLYAGWVVGAGRVRAVDAAWPAAGTRLHHSAGTWPFLLDDSTSVLAYDPAGQLELRARGWPAGTALVRLRWVELGPRRLLLTLEEDADAGPALLVPRPLRHHVLEARNLETLHRLALLLQGGAGARR